MPYGPNDAQKHNSKANTPRLQRMWSDVFNSTLSRGGDEAKAFREANGAINNDYARRRQKRRAKSLAT